MALGAQARQIRALVLRRGLIVAAAGAVLGPSAAAGFTRLMQSLLFGIEPLDPITFAAGRIVLGAAALVAAYLPARRALSVDPTETMRLTPQGAWMVVPSARCPIKTGTFAGFSSRWYRRFKWIEGLDL